MACSAHAMFARRRMVSTLTPLAAQAAVSMLRRLAPNFCTTPTTRRKRSSSTTRASVSGTEDSEKSGRWRLEIELERREHTRIHVVSADQHGQFHDLARIEMAFDFREHRVRHRDVAGHRIG